MDAALRSQTTTLRGDLVLDPRREALLEEQTLETALYLSLFTDRRAEPEDELPSGAARFQRAADPGGWWADADYGSRLWLLARQTLTSETLERARSYALEALAWLIDEGLAGDVEVVPIVPRDGWLGLEITVSRPDAPPERYAYVWEV